MGCWKYIWWQREVTCKDGDEENQYSRFEMEGMNESGPSALEV